MNEEEKGFIYMSTGFIYIVNTLSKEYVQDAFCRVPTQFGNRIYFGPCKKPMRPKIKPGDYIFGISPSHVGTRRIVFICNVEERITFGEAYQRFPYLRGPEGPIHVQPVNGSGKFPNCSYKHIPGSIHPDNWEKDLGSPELDAFFVCHIQKSFVGRWLGKYGPEVNHDIFNFIRRKCSVHGQVGKLSDYNKDATLSNPVVYRKLFTGLHLETNEPNTLLGLCDDRMHEYVEYLDEIPIPSRHDIQSGSCRTC